MYHVRMTTTLAYADADALSRFGRALADATRRRILLALVEGPAYPSELTGLLGCTKANVSNHLACLRGCGLVRAVPEGRRVRYELAGERLGDALALLCELVIDVDPACGAPAL